MESPQEVTSRSQSVAFSEREGAVNEDWYFAGVSVDRLGLEEAESAEVVEALVGASVGGVRDSADFAASVDQRVDGNAPLLA
jgi:hypothetical protein